MLPSPASLPAAAGAKASHPLRLCLGLIACLFRYLDARYGGFAYFGHAGHFLYPADSKFGHMLVEEFKVCSMNRDQGVGIVNLDLRLLLVDIGVKHPAVGNESAARGKAKGDAHASLVKIMWIRV